MPKINVKDRALVRMLAHLNDKQLIAFREYLSCSLFNTSQAVNSLFEQLVLKALTSEDRILGQQELLDGTNIAPSTTDKLFSQLLTHLNNFVTLWYRREGTKHEFSHTLNAWLQIGLEPELLEREYRKMKRKLGGAPSSDVDIFYALRLMHSYSQFKVSQPRKEQRELFATHMELLESFYLTSKLKYMCAAISAGRVFQGKEHELLSVDAAVIENLPPIGKAYYKAYSLLINPEPQLESAQNLFGLLKANNKSFSEEDRGDLYGFLLNSCIRNLPKGDQLPFQSLTYEVYNAMLAQDLLVQAGQMAGGHFKNIVSIRARMGALSEARTFIAAYQHLLAPEEEQILVTYTEGLISFHEGDHRTAIQKFRTTVQDSPEDLFWSLESRNMLWKCYFEIYDKLDQIEHEEMLKLYDSFRLYVSRNSRISDYHKESYLNFIRVFNRLIKVGDQRLWASTVLDLEGLYLEVQEMEKIVHKNWILNAVQTSIKKLAQQ